MSLPIRFTDTFDESYARLPIGDVSAVDAMLDRLESEHAGRAMRTVLRVGAVTLFATPRIRTPGGLYRITWCYDDRTTPAAIIAITVARVD